MGWLVILGAPPGRGRELSDGAATATVSPSVPLDLLIRGGEVALPGQETTVRTDVGVQDGRIAALGPDLGSWVARERLDVRGMLVTPGLIDLHAHVYNGVTTMGIAPDAVAFPGGVTTLADGGSSGPPGIAGFARYVAGPAACRVLCMVNWSRLGLIGSQAVGELQDARYADPDGVAQVLTDHPGLVRAIKLRVSADVTGGPSAPFVRAASSVARAVGVPLHLHIGHSVETITEIVGLLAPHDMITHFQTPKRPNLLDDEMRLVPGLREARERGILFDCGHGKTHFDFGIARSLLEQEFPPDTLSSDVSRTSYSDLAPGLLTVANKWWALGWPLGDIVAAMTTRPARWLGLGDGIGQLTLGAIADLAILDRVEGERMYVDAAGAELLAHHWLEPRATVFAGKVVWRGLGTD